MRLLKLVILIILFFIPSTSGAGWLIYHEQAFNGKVIDIETKQPVEGAVVVALYEKNTFGFGAGNIDSVIKVAEILTDAEGNFHLPSYTTVIQPFSWQIRPSFIIFKPGYASLDQLPLADYLTGKNIEEQEGIWPYPEYKGLEYKVRSPGVVELPKLKTQKQVWYSNAIHITGFSAKELPLLYKAMDDVSKLLRGGYIAH